MLAKFSSIINHVMNIHHHESQLFPQCVHGELPERKWIQPGSAPATKIAQILDSTWLRKDVKMLSPCMQTSSVESFHALINQYAPKMHAFSYEGMLCRIYLAALHFNENASRKQAMDRHGNPAFHIHFPRAKQSTGGYSVRKVLVKSTYCKYFSSFQRKKISMFFFKQRKWLQYFTHSTPSTMHTCTVYARLFYVNKQNIPMYF
jgi:hypothetical protein